MYTYIYIYIYIHTYKGPAGIEVCCMCICTYESLLDLCVSSLSRGHANILCIVPILTDDPRRESNAACVFVHALSPSSGKSQR